MTTHRWTSSTRLKRHDTGEVIQSGETFEPTESEFRAYGNQIEELQDADGGADETVTTDSAGSEDAVTFDEDAWFDDHDDYQDRIETVESGVVDDVLEEIEEVERSDNVIDAVEARRDDPDDE